MGLGCGQPGLVQPQQGAGRIQRQQRAFHGQLQGARFFRQGAAQGRHGDGSLPEKQLGRGIAQLGRKGQGSGQGCGRPCRGGLFGRSRTAAPNGGRLRPAHSLLRQTENKVALQGSLLALAQIFQRKIDAVNLGRPPGGVGPEHAALAQYQAVQLHRQRAGLLSGGLWSSCGRKARLMRRARRKSGGVQAQHGVVQAHFPHHHLAGEQGGPLQLGHAALDSQRGAAGGPRRFISLGGGRVGPPAGRAETHAGREKSDVRRTGKNQRLPRGLGRGCSNAAHHKVGVHPAQQHGPRGPQEYDERQYGEQNPSHPVSLGRRFRPPQARTVTGSILSIRDASRLGKARGRPATGAQTPRLCAVARQGAVPAVLRMYIL